MTTYVAWSALLGSALGSGLWLSFVRLPVMRKRRFVERVAPQLKSLDAGSRLFRAVGDNITPFGPLERIFRPVLHDAVRRLNRFNPVSGSLAKRLAQSGTSKSVVDFRAEQIIWGGLGILAGAAFLGVLASNGTFNGFLGLVVLLGFAVGGFVFRDYVLGMKIKSREAKMLAEFPSLAELMALAVSAGESAVGALERICRTAHGELSKEFATVLAETRSGIPLLSALKSFSNRTELAPLARFVDGITVAVERGTPLADVLRAQAQDVRDMAKRELMESAGRKEIGMMVPLVFGVLPLSVVFAIFPGIALLNLGL